MLGHIVAARCRCLHGRRVELRQPVVLRGRVAHRIGRFDRDDRIVKLRRVNDGLSMTAFYEYPRDNGGDGELGSLWSGEKFPDGFVRKISLSVKDRV